MTRLFWCLIVLVGLVASTDPLFAQSPGAPMRRLLESGRLPEARVPQVLEMLATRGDETDLGWLLEQATAADGFQGPNQLAALNQLATAATTRRMKPAGDLSVLGSLLADDKSPEVVRLAVKLAGEWQVESLADKLSQLAQSDKTPQDIREAAAASLGSLGGDVARKALMALSEPSQPIGLRTLGVSGLAGIDLDLAATRAAETLASATSEDDPTDLVAAFLDRQDGTAKLAGALGNVKLEPDVAKQALRHLYSIGRTDEALVNALASAAGMEASPPPPTPEQVAQISKAVAERGDPHRGEEIFRRKELSCLKCHAISKAGGDIGPDLSPVGAASPIDYLVNSLLVPELAVKEEYRLVTVIDFEGRIHRGIIVEENEDNMTLKDAEGRKTTIPQDPDNEIVAGGSLMPGGLTRFLTEQEFLDLIAYLGELGRPGDFAIRSKPTLQRWRVLKEPSPELLTGIPDEEVMEEHAWQADPSRWLPAYAKTAGSLPLAEFVTEAKSPILYMTSDISVTRTGQLTIALSSREGVAGWIDDEPLPASGDWKVHLDEGEHRLTLRIDTEKAPAEIGAVLQAPTGATIEFQPVDGP